MVIYLAVEEFDREPGRIIGVFDNVNDAIKALPENNRFSYPSVYELPMNEVTSSPPKKVFEA